MNAFTIALPAEQAHRIRELAREARNSPAQLLSAGVEEWLTPPPVGILRKLRRSSCRRTENCTGGWRSSMRHLTIEEVLELHRLVITQSGGGSGVRHPTPWIPPWPSRA